MAMENQGFRIRASTVWILVVGHALLIITGAIAKIQHWAFSGFLLTAGFVLFFPIWMIVLNDMTKSRIRNKAFWIK